MGCHGVSKTTCFKAPGVSLGGSGVSIGGVRMIKIIVPNLGWLKKIPSLQKKGLWWKLYSFNGRLGLLGWMFWPQIFQGVESILHVNLYNINLDFFLRKKFTGELRRSYPAFLCVWWPFGGELLVTSNVWGSSSVTATCIIWLFVFWWFFLHLHHPPQNKKRK